MSLSRTLTALLVTLAFPASASAGFGMPELVTVPGSWNSTSPNLVGSSPSLDTHWFLTTEGVSGADTDGNWDVYRRDGAGLALVTPGTTLPVTAAKVSPNGEWLAFETTESLVGGDADNFNPDVYRRNLATGQVDWVSQGGNSVLYGSALRDVVDSGAVFFVTSENLSGSDVDTGGGADAYRGTGAGTPTLLSGANSTASVTLERVARDGSAAIIRTAEPLLAGDADTAVDLYRTTGSVTLISDDGANPDPNTSAGFVAGASENLDVVYFYTAEPLDPTGVDVGGTDDVYRWPHSPGAVDLVTGSGTSGVQSGIASADGLHFWFHTGDSLLAGDTGGTDVHEYANGALSLVSGGTATGALLAGVAGDRVFFTSAGDVYERTAGITTLRTPGTTTDVAYEGVSPDGARVFYKTLAPLVAEDTDVESDVYTTEDGGPALVSRGGPGSEGIGFERASAGGDAVLLSTVEPLVAADTDVFGTDYYVARAAAGQAPSGPPPADAPPGDQQPVDEPVAPGPVPVEGKLFNAQPVSGVVLVRLPGSSRFTPVADLTSIPNGSIVDARKGRVRLFTTDGRGGFQSSDFYGGMFRITQQAGGLVELALTGGTFKGCAPAGKARASAARAVRKLWGSGHGKFRTKGRFASATVRGTTWLTEDRCSGTLVRVKEGAVVARDLVKRRNVVLKAGRQYLAAAKATAARRAKKRR